MSENNSKPPPPPPLPNSSTISGTPPPPLPVSKSASPPPITRVKSTSQPISKKSKPDGKKRRSSEEKLEDEIQEKIEENRNIRKKGKIIFPTIFIFSIILIANDWSFFGWTVLICDILYLLVLWVSNTNYDTVKNSILKEREEKKKEQLEKERLKLERQKNIDKYGCSFENTELIEDEFSEKSIITTKRFGTFKQSGLFQEVKYVNQSSQLDYHHMAMPSVNIDTTRGMWASVKLEQSKTLKKYFLEFHFRYENRTRDKGWDSQPSAESCVLDILCGGEKYNLNINLIQNDKNEYAYNIAESNMKTSQTFNFKISLDILKLISSEGVKMRLSNFSNMGEKGTNTYPIKPEFISALKSLAIDFCNDLGIN